MKIVHYVVLSDVWFEKQALFCYNRGRGTIKLAGKLK